MKAATRMIASYRLAAILHPRVVTAVWAIVIVVVSFSLAILLTGCTVMHTDSMTAIVVGNGVAERACSTAPVCQPGIPDACERAESRGFSGGFAGVLEAAVAAASAYFTAGAL